MNTRAHASLHLPLLIAGVAAMLLGAVATTPLTVSIQSAAEGLKNFIAPGDSRVELLPPVAEPPEKPALDTRAKARCEECGVIESTWEPEARSEKTKIYETVVRLQDGSTLVINDVNPATRRPGERVKLIRGTE
jgi:hypothetical protein